MTCTPVSKMVQDCGASLRHKNNHPAAPSVWTCTPSVPWSLPEPKVGQSREVFVFQSTRQGERAGSHSVCETYAPGWSWWCLSLYPMVLE